jgi:perosamine synthetase
MHPSELVDEVLRGVRSVLGEPSEMIALHAPEFAGREWDYVKECIDTGWVSSVGSFVDRFERTLEQVTGAKHAIATSNGTSALHICLLLAGVKPGDEVLLPTLTFIATANAVSYTGAVPHFVDSESTSLAVDADRLDEYLSGVAVRSSDGSYNRATGRRIRALVVMHAFGHPAQIESLVRVSERWGLVLVEDAAESLGSYYRDRHTGNFGAVAALSFNGNKLVTTGGGGAVLTNDASVAKRAKHLTTTARVPHRWSFLHDEVGFNYRLPNINAALGVAQLEQLPEVLRAKRTLAARYQAAFASSRRVRMLAEPTGTTSNYWLNTLVLAESSIDDRDELLGALNEANFMSRPLWTLMHRLPMYAECPRDDLRVAEDLERRVINLPSSARLGR